MVTQCIGIVHKNCTQSVYEELGCRHVCTMCVNKSGERAEIEFWGTLSCVYPGNDVTVLRKNPPK